MRLGMLADVREYWSRGRFSVSIDAAAIEQEGGRKRDCSYKRIV